MSPIRRMTVALALAWMAASIPQAASSDVRLQSTGPHASGPVHSDFNGDGFADLALGVPVEDVGSEMDAGWVHVLYGSGGGLQSTTPDDQIWSQNAAGVKDDSEGFDLFGFTIASGDFNGDGFADLAVGVPGEGTGDIIQAGAVQVFYGSADGLQATSPDDQIWTQDSPGVKDEATYNDLYGETVAAGDFNGDGFADLTVGVISEDKEIANTGAVSVLYGSSCGLEADPAVCGGPDDQFWTQNSPKVEDSGGGNDLFGARLATGDFNGDGFADVAVGVFNEDANLVGDAGAAHILYGSEAGLQATAPDDQVWGQGSSDVKGFAQSADLFGSSLAAGDFNRDGFDDLAVGVPSDFADGVSAGSVNVLYGSNQGLQATSPDDQLWTQADSEVKGSAESGNSFGASLALGDFNGDGFDDLSVGVTGQQVRNVNFAGAVSVLYGSVQGLQATSPDDQIWSQARRGVKDGPETNDFFGYSLAGGDFNGDGFVDLVMGVIGEGVKGIPVAGAVNVLSGSTCGLQAHPEVCGGPDDQFWSQASPGVKGIAEGGDKLGWSLAAGG